MNLKDLPHHHAILILHNNRVLHATRLFKELELVSHAHRFFDQTVLDIATARSIITWANTPYNEEKIAVISFHTIGLEAQNALLKILEEPRGGVRFILVTSNISSIIETVLSRVLLVQDKQDNEVLEEGKLFLSTNSANRIKLPYIIDTLSRVDEEGRKDRESVRIFILSLATIMMCAPSNNNYVQKILEVASYASDPSASGKALLEYLSLLLPQTKV